MGNEVSKFVKYIINTMTTFDSMEALSADDRTEIVWQYWFRVKMTKKNKFITIDHITPLILNYFGSMMPYRGKFIQANCGKGLEI